MRVRATLAALLLLFVAGPAASETPAAEPPADEEAIARPTAHPAECARLHRQIAHFEGMAARADALGNELWTERTEKHVELLRERQKQRCPGDVPDDSAKEAFLAFMGLLKVAGKAALSYFTFGAF